MNNPDINKHPKRRMKLKKRREEKDPSDILTECARVFLFSLARNRGEARDYEGVFHCSGDSGEVSERERLLHAAEIGEGE